MPTAGGTMLAQASHQSNLRTNTEMDCAARHDLLSGQARRALELTGGEFHAPRRILCAHIPISANTPNPVER